VPCGRKHHSACFLYAGSRYFCRLNKLLLPVTTSAVPTVPYNGALYPPIACSMIIYIHGFNSSSQSTKARQLGDYLAARSMAYACPDLPHRPAEAIALLSGLIAAQPRASVKLIGSSLGGFYATWLADKFDVKAVLINPAVHVQNSLKTVLGPQQNYYSGEEYILSQQHLDELAALDQPAPLRPQNFLLLVETGDEVLDYRDAVSYYAASRQIVVPGGDHGFQHFTQYIDTILAF
jgi:predicted esterase YcpF (UPF0227 family)